MFDWRVGQSIRHDFARFSAGLLLRPHIYKTHTYLTKQRHLAMAALYYG
jgi:hypothetical protein